MSRESRGEKFGCDIGKYNKTKIGALLLDETCHVLHVHDNAQMSAGVCRFVVVVVVVPDKPGEAAARRAVNSASIVSLQCLENNLAFAIFHHDILRVIQYCINSCIYLARTALHCTA